MRKRLTFFILVAVSCCTVSHGQILVDDVINPAYAGLHAWYDGNEALGADGVAETPIWPNKQGDTARDITAGFAPGDFMLEPVEVANGHMGLRIDGAVTWAEAAEWGDIFGDVTVVVAAEVRDPDAAYLFTSNEGGGGAEGNANFDTPTLDVWTMKAESGRIETGPLVVDEFQLHTFIFSNETTGHHYINGELAGTGEIGFAGMAGFVLGGRQNGGQRANVDFGEVLVFNEALSDANRESVEGYLDNKFFGASTGLDCDFTGAEGCDINDLNAIYAGTDGAPTLSANSISDWLTQASAADNPLKADAAHVYVTGDINLDGSVDSTDLGLLLNNFGAVGDELSWSDGNLNPGNAVNSADLGLLLNNFGATSSAAAVPEPTGVNIALLLLVGLFPFLRKRRVQR